VVGIPSLVAKIVFGATSEETSTLKVRVPPKKFKKYIPFPASSNLRAATPDVSFPI